MKIQSRPPMYSLPINDLENIAERVQDIWPKQQSILITGGTGFFGRWLVESIAFVEEKLKSENKYIVISRQKSLDLEQKIPVFKKGFFEFVEADLQDLESLNDPVDFVIHAASDVVGIKSGKCDFASILKATQNLIGVLQNKKLKKFLYVSSGGVYSDSETGHIESELSTDDLLKLNMNSKPESYAYAKINSEKAVIQSALKWPIQIVRCFSFVGPYADSSMAVMQFLQQKLTSNLITVQSPNVVRSFMYPTDLVVGLIQALYKSDLPQILNLGSERSITLKEVAEKINAIGPLGTVQIKENVNQISLAGRCYYPDITLAKKELGFVPSIDLDLALQKTYTFYKNGVS